MGDHGACPFRPSSEHHFPPSGARVFPFLCRACRRDDTRNDAHDHYRDPGPGREADDKKKVLVKQLSAIEDFGSVDILCTDKTGTLTEGEIVLDRHVDFQGKDNENVLQLIYLNSHFEAGIKSPLDDAI